MLRPALLAAGLLTACSLTATAKPPELPADPHVGGRERSPADHEFYRPAAAPALAVELPPAGQAVPRTELVWWFGVVANSVAGVFVGERK